MFDKAVLIIRLHALENGVDVHKLLHGGRTKNLAGLRKSLRVKLREQTTLSWSEINELTGHAKSSRRP